MENCRRRSSDTGPSRLAQGDADAGFQRRQYARRGYDQALSPVRRCDDAGFLIPLICDLKIENGSITWDNDIPPGGAIEFPRSPIGFHDVNQVLDTPLFEPDRFLIKFHNLWSIEAPEGYSLLFTHPLNRFDLPFTTLSGMVDCDRFRDSWIYFPAHWHDMNFSGVLPMGTPVAQCLPVKRELGRPDRAVYGGGEPTGPRTDQGDRSRAMDCTVGNSGSSA